MVVLGGTRHRACSDAHCRFRPVVGQQPRRVRVEQLVDVLELERPSGAVDQVEVPVLGMPAAVCVGTGEHPDVDVEPLITLEAGSVMEDADA